MVYWDNASYLEHYGIPRRSGRFPWGSGKNPYHHGQSMPRGFTQKGRLEKYTKKKAIADASIRKLGKYQASFTRNPESIRQRYYGGNASYKKIQKDIDRSRKAFTRDSERYGSKADKIREKIIAKSVKKDKAISENILKKPTEKEKANIITSGKASEILKYRKFLSNNEMQMGLKRIQLESSLKQYSAADRDRGIKILESVADKVNRTTSAIEKMNNSAERLGKLAQNLGKLQGVQEAFKKQNGQQNKSSNNSNIKTVDIKDNQKFSGLKNLKNLEKKANKSNVSSDTLDDLVRKGWSYTQIAAWLNKKNR